MRVLNKVWVLVLLFALGSASLFSSPLRMIGVGDPILEDYIFLVRSAEGSVLSVTPPLSSEEILLNVRSLSTANRSPAWRAAYTRVLRALQEPPVLKDGPFGMTLHPELALEGRWRSNTALEWIREEKQNPAVLSLPLEFFFANSLYARGDLVVRNDPSFYDDGESHGGTNLPLDVQKLDANIPLKGFIASGGPWWNVQLGRDRLSFGTGHGGNLTISDSPDYYDFARLSLFSSNFKYSLLVTQLPLETPDYFYAEGFDLNTETEPTYTTQRYLYLHRWDLRLWKRLSIGLSEGVLVGNSPLELRFLNPLIIYHSFFSWLDYPEWGSETGEGGDMNGSVVALDLEWALRGGISLYGQMVMNQFATPYELEHWPEDNSPNGLGWLGGVEYNGDVAGWRSVFFLEGVYTDPYLYVLSSPFASFIWMRRLSDLTSKKLRYSWLGYPEGRDVMSLTLGSTMRRDPLSLSWALSYLSRGEHSIQWDWEKGITAVQEHTPTGTAEQNWIISSELRWQVIKPLWLTFFGAFQWVQNWDHQSGRDTCGTEFALSARYSF